jgi:hypothetical protein
VLTTNATVYLVHADTLTVPDRAGLSGTLYLRLPKDVLKPCELYRP